MSDEKRHLDGMGDGGPAFLGEFAETIHRREFDGTLVKSTGNVTHRGMSLRDYFAGQALAGVMDKSPVLMLWLATRLPMLS